MRNTETLQEYLKRVTKAQAEVEEALRVIKEDLKDLERQEAIIYGQKMTLEQLLDYDNVPPVTEYPVAGDGIEERHDNRLDGPDGLSQEEVEDARKDVYEIEAKNTAEAIDEINSGEDSGDDS